MRWIILLLLLGACTTEKFDEELRPELHGEAPTEMPQFPEELAQPVAAEEIEYFDTNGYFVQPEAQGTYPGVIMIHEWWGLNEHIKSQARQLASEGYLVFAVDLFEGSVATDAATAREQVTNVDQEEAIANMQAAAAFLREKNVQTIASLGWCFGGGQSMELALTDTVDATVIYYGRVVTEEEQLTALDHPVLGIFGREDPVIPVDGVEQFDTLLDTQGVEHAVHIYDNVGHAFANPDNDGFAEEEAQDAWAKTLAFLEQHT